ncbi:probable dolichyl pyrophosphate Glc1Man9GlcNAc2 alpha-1,3-glucosyltransferase [Daphnia pulicaria]|uniref:probable dolichyl pyrophosphate Glc1Man9GlcNAc2 alpha-1,3-glucosyltransferase n=1 Tax=Daphnia pulicaria TaxID=35523 RepID=UPI001EEB13FD|nr:probable dolichyl pyrophosphate Glc1Man9GlcNAc2 alpha-1,3-glucosyltransferase [Daphnia pulicaria]
MLWRIFASITFGKLLFIPSYRSTDFEVHRNWLAVTHSLPLNKWYVDDTSQWTLDYPPLFAWFEYLLSWVACLFDPEMLKVENLNYASQNTVLFQRISVIFTDVVYALGVQKCLYSIGSTQGGKLQNNSGKWFSSPTILAFLLLCNVGLFIVDHIHFQYNGFLTGILLLSVGSILQKENLKAAFWFSVLLNLKHIYLYIAPVYFVYLFRSYCIEIQKSRLTFHFKRLIKLGMIVVTTFGVAYGPFVGQFQQVMSRLFPFENRGLCHAYWAPNFWAIYNIVDKILAVSARLFGWTAVSTTTASMTGGLVQEFEHSILPSVGPKTTLICTLLALIPAIVILLRQPNQPRVFVRAIVLCAFASFLFGWHVHEKAILIVITPLTLLAVSSHDDCRLFLLLSMTGHVSLFPLLFTPFENVSKIFLVLTYSLASYSFLSALHYDPKSKSTLVKFRSWERLFLYGLVAVALFESFIHSMVDPSGKLPFLPLLIMSVYCAVGVIYVWLLFVIASLKTEKKISKQK